MRILWLKTELLHPVDKGGKIRTYYMLKELKREHHVTYLTLDDGTATADERAKATEYCHELVCIPQSRREKFTPGFYFELLLNLVSPRPYAIKKYESAAMLREITELERKNAFDLLVCDFLAPAANVPPTLNTPAVLFQHNVEAMIWKRHYEVQTNPIKKAYLYGQWQKMRRFEKEMCGRFDCVIAVSADDRDQMKSEYGAQSVFDVPTGVDTEFFRPSGAIEASKHGIVFTGSMDWLPNEDGIRYFMREIMPLIRKKLPDATLTVVGRNPPSSLVDLSKEDRSLVITGRVEDVRPYIEGASAYIVPLRIGGGTRLKIFEAMAMEKPVVSTTIGAEGLPLTNGVELLLADEPETFSDAVVKVLSDPAYAHELGQRAAATVRQKHGWQQVTQDFIGICNKANHPQTTQKSVQSVVTGLSPEVKNFQ
ncbi:MAG TPA: glycosyltransferase [Pyrinomonadaceae bacterium]|nr:glycosyltransferase [Pyrinomonadaceae bacterium]